MLSARWCLITGGLLYSYLEEHRVLKEEQALSQPNRLTQDVILRATDDWKSVLDCGRIVTTVMIDSSKT